jgi:2'-5' RNA ligase
MENLHVTSYFIGETGQGELSAIKEKIGAIAGNMLPIELVLDRISLWPARKPYMVWAVFQENSLFTKLNRKLEEELWGSRGNGPVIPHITLARFKDYTDTRQVMLSSTEFPDQLIVDHIILFESRLSPLGPTYYPLVRFPLGASPPPPGIPKSR